MTSLSTQFDSDACRPVMASTPRAGDTSPGDTGVLERRCLWCRCLIESTQEKWCSKLCRQTAWRWRQIQRIEDVNSAPKRLAYADPPFPGLSRKYYSDQPTFAGEVDHRRLVEQLSTFDGWALSTSQKALSDVLSLCPRGVEVCPWVKTRHHPPARGIANIHEYVLVVPARRRKPGVPDALVCAVARGGDSDLMGRKPIKFISWLFQLLGALPVDSLDDKFPGSGIVGRCWDEFRRSAPSPTPASATLIGGAL